MIIAALSMLFLGLLELVPPGEIYLLIMGIGKTRTVVFPVGETKKILSYI